jgi:hypothetical protein
MCTPIPATFTLPSCTLHFSSISLLCANQIAYLLEVLALSTAFIHCREVLRRYLIHAGYVCVVLTSALCPPAVRNQENYPRLSSPPPRQESMPAGYDQLSATRLLQESSIDTSPLSSLISKTSPPQALTLLLDISNLLEDFSVSAIEPVQTDSPQDFANRIIPNFGRFVLHC